MSRYHPVGYATACTDGSEYTSEEAELLRAVERYREQRGKRFLSHVDVFRVALSLGYRKPEGATEGEEGT